MKNANLGWLFYREYFRGYDWPDQKDKRAKEQSEKFFAYKNKLLYGFGLTKYEAETAYPALPADRFQAFELTTDYPGLLIGTGYNHDVAAVGATKIGFYFDHTTGLPTIPGSTVKGILRSVFPGRDEARGKPGNTELAKGKLAYLIAVLKEIGIAAETVNEAFVKRLETELFEGQLPGEAQLPMAHRFVCHDAVVVAAEGQLMGTDFITPHKKPATGEPNPIQLLKVMPGVRFRFTFQLAGGKETPSCLTAAQTLALVKRILLDMGIGAKTNVGYGQLIDPNAPSGKNYRAASGNSSASPTAGTSVQETDLPVFKPTSDKWYAAGSLNPKRPPVVNGKVLKKLSDRSVQVQLLIAGREDKSAVLCELKIFTGGLPAPSQWVKVQIKSFSGKKAKSKGFLLKDNYYELIGKS